MCQCMHQNINLAAKPKNDWKIAERTVKQTIENSHTKAFAAHLSGSTPTGYEGGRG